jgi:hypothetical protein
MEEKGTFHDLIFNSTEFRTGNNFRFRVVPDGKKLIYGNSNTRIKKEVAEQVELADIIAATSCFPGAFEPMRFPEDFRFADRTQVADPFRKNDFNFTSVSLMDGGILDNQGLYGMTVSYDDPPQPFDLMIVSDTSGRDEDIYSLDLDERAGGISLKGWLLLLGVFAAAFLLGSLWLLYSNFIRDGSFFDKAVGTLIGLAVLLLTTGVIVGLIYGVSKIKSLPLMGFDFPIWQHIKGLTLHDLWMIGKGRILSAKAMVFTVFMNRIRNLQFANTMSAIDIDKGRLSSTESPCTRSSTPSFRTVTVRKR